MTISNIDRAATIKSLATKADQVSREGLEINRQIGEQLNAEKLVQGHGKFLPWFEGQSFGFSIQWARRLMKLDERWEDITKAQMESGRFPFGVEANLALLKPKPIQPADAERVLKLAEVSTERGASEGEAAMAEKQITKMAERYGTTPEKVIAQSRKKVERLELLKALEAHEEQAEAELLSEIERLQDLLRQHGIPF